MPPGPWPSLDVEIHTGEIRAPAEPPEPGSTCGDNLVDWYVGSPATCEDSNARPCSDTPEVFEPCGSSPDRSCRRRPTHPAQIDDAFGRMRAEGKSHSRMNNARAALSGAYKWGRRHQKVRANPMRGFEIPKSTHVPRKT